MLYKRTKWINKIRNLFINKRHDHINPSNSCSMMHPNHTKQKFCRNKKYITESLFCDEHRKGVPEQEHLEHSQVYLSVDLAKMCEYPSCNRQANLGQDLCPWHESKDIRMVTLDEYKTAQRWSYKIFTEEEIQIITKIKGVNCVRFIPRNRIIKRNGRHKLLYRRKMVSCKYKRSGDIYVRKSLSPRIQKS